MSKQNESLIKRFWQSIMRNKFKAAVVLLALAAAGGLGRLYLAPAGFDWKSLAKDQPVSPASDVLAGQPEAKPGKPDLMVGPWKNKFGIRVKVITKKPHVRCSNEPNGVPDGQELGYFHPYFVFEIVRFKDNPDVIYYEIGPTPRKVDKFGWVSSFDVQRWDTRVGDRYDRPMDANGKYLDAAIPALYVYGTREDAIASLTDRKVPPLAEARLDCKSRPLMAWPIISAPEKVEANNKTYELHQLAFLGAYEPGSNVINPGQPASAASAKTKEEKAEISAGVKRIDVVFVIDSTFSMTPYIEQVREAVKKITNGLKGVKSFTPDIAFGAVEYRDYVDNLKFAGGNAFYVHPLTEDADMFLMDMNNVKAATIDSLDFSEAVFDGLLGAINLMNWRPVYAERIIVLIGDDPSHDLSSERNPSQLTAQKIIAAATLADKHVAIFSLMAPTTGGIEEIKEHAEQFGLLAKETKGSCHTLSNADDVVPLIEQFVGGSIQKAEEKDQVVTGIVVGDIDLRGVRPVIRNPNLQLTEDQVTEVLKFLSSVGVDGKELAPGEITFSTGWVITASEDQIILKKQVYLAKAELQFLMGEIWSISQTLGYKADSVQEIFKQVVSSLTEGTFLKSETDLPMDAWLMVKGTPVHPNSLLSFTKEELLSLPEDQRLNLQDKIMQKCWPSLLNALNNQPIVYFPDPDPLSFGWIDEEFLP